ncbi:ABC transporter substrate-binding protein [Nocardioides carbamazepini]|uniref:ABC transporter substrate-binding protein n=1 Tax=Nocardioides carbamazepini TaxID=2854259 RepID=UPI00214A2FBD|nr:ABC transporter substrate-binding protein [Nocardioides carbamazepini]MCR1781244.1 ABC transporter substrate-binding protein [Nocardioides carbamazepini]
MTRRRFGARRAPIAVATAFAAAVALSGCSGDTDPGAKDDAGDDTLAECQSAAPTGGFEYVDTRGTEVSLDEVPTTVVAQNSIAASLWDAGYKVDGIYGELGDDPASAYQRGNVDLAELTTLGKTWGEFDVDAFAAMEPDLLLDFSFSGELWYVPSKLEKQINDLAPILGLNGQPKDIDEAIELFVDLAGKLGADTTCNEELLDAKEDYQEALAAVTANEKDLKVLVASGSETSLWVVNPDELPETGTLKSAGVDLISAEGASNGKVFTELSWEQAPGFADADVILMDIRNTDAVKEKMKGIDTWANLPAVKAGQVYEWYAGAPYSYQAYAEIFDELADQLEDAKPLG